MATVLERFALCVLEEHYGALVARVARVLLSLDRAKFPVILTTAKKEGMSERLVVDSLVVLIQHNMLATNAPPEEESGVGKAKEVDDTLITLLGDERDLFQVGHLYALDLHAVVCRSFMALEACHLERVFPGVEAPSLIRNLAVHGRLSQSQLRDLYVAHLNALVSRDTPPTTSRFLRKVGEADGEERTKLTRHMFGRLFSTLSTQLRLLESCDDDDADDSDIEPRSKRRKLGDKPKQKPEKCWKVCHQRFMFDFQVDRICQYVEERTSATCSFVVRRLLRHPEVHNKFSMHHQLTNGVSHEQLFQIVLPSPGDFLSSVMDDDEDDSDADESPDAAITPLVPATIQSPPSLDRKQVKVCVSDLMSDPRVPIMTKLGEAEGVLDHDLTYHINLRAILREICTESSQAIVRGKLDVESARIFKLLILKKQLEEKQISEMAMVPKKQARACLYAMHKRHMVHLQEIAKTTDRHPARTFYLWSVPLEEVRTRLLEEMYRTWVNLSNRRNHEQKSLSRQIQKMREDVVLDKEERIRVGKWDNAQRHIDLSLNRLLRQIMLFRVFHADEPPSHRAPKTAI